MHAFNPIGFPHTMFGHHPLSFLEFLRSWLFLLFLWIFFLAFIGSSWVCCVFQVLVSGCISNSKVISSCFHTFVIISAQDRICLLFHELRLDLDSSSWPAIDKVRSAAGKNTSYCPQRRNLTHGSPKVRVVSRAHVDVCYSLAPSYPDDLSCA